MKKILYIILLSILTFNSYSQTDTIRITNLKAEDVVNLDLPPIEYFLKGVDNNSRVKFYFEQTKAEEYALKSLKNTWLNYIRIMGNGQYGYTDDFTQLIETSSPTTSKYFGKTQFYYGAGLTLSLPFSEIFDKGNKVKAQKAKISASKYEAELWKDDIRSKIIDAYTAAQTNLNILKAMSDALTVANAQYRLTEIDFISGRIDAIALSRQKTIQAQAIASFENARGMLLNSLLKLELATNVKIVK